LLVRDTDDVGGFSFAAQYEPYVITVIHDAGYARVSGQPDEQPDDVRLQPWARVEGRLLQAGQPVPKAEVTLRPLRPRFYPLPRVDETFRQTTDDSGRFMFDRVPPGKCQLMARLSVWDEYPITSSQAVPLDLQPGQQVTVDLGGHGAEVTGRVVLSGDVRRQIDLKYSLNYLLRKTAGVEPPPELAAKGFDWRRGWSDAWTSTEEGLAYLETRPHYFVKLNRDGTFVVSGVPAGQYELALRIYEPPTAGCLVSPVGSRVIPFEVTERDEQAGRLSLGDLPVEASLGPQPPDMAPDFEFETTMGGSERLSNYRGRHVLVNFWATWCGPCMASLPGLRKIHDQFESDRLAVVSLSLDADKDAARTFIQEQNLPGIHGLLGEWSQTSVPSQYGISSAPAYFLIAPDGKLIYRGYDLAELSKSLEGTLDDERK
jgi:peroxiredoxin